MIHMAMETMVMDMALLKNPINRFKIKSKRWNKLELTLFKRIMTESRPLKQLLKTLMLKVVQITSRHCLTSGIVWLKQSTKRKLIGASHFKLELELSQQQKKPPELTSMLLRQPKMKLLTHLRKKSDGQSLLSTTMTSSIDSMKLLQLQEWKLMLAVLK